MLKERIVNSVWGSIALRLRDALDLHLTAWNTPENLCDVSNNILARRILERICSDGKIFLDVGCHIGSVVAGVSRHSKPAKIIAVEAIPEKVASLRSRFPQLEVHECAVSEHEGTAEFIIDTSHSGNSSLNPELVAGTSQLRKIQVDVKTLDSIVPHDDIDVIKIDVEGAELGVLRGSIDIVGKSRPVIMFESGPQEIMGYTKKDMWQWFADRDYLIVLPNRLAHNNGGISLDLFISSHLYPRFTTNYFAVPAERYAEVSARIRRMFFKD